jgi:uncharacterized damage-inducible protein DinB
VITFQEFFSEKFEFDLHANLAWTAQFEASEDALSPYLIQSMSHIINVHHIWNSRLLHSDQESLEWDVLPISFMERLHRANFQATMDFMENYSLEEKINYHDSEGVALEKPILDILYHILYHSNYHRAQIAKETRDLGLPVVSANFIVFK